MAIIDVHVGRIEFGACSGMIYSYDAIMPQKITVDGNSGSISSQTLIRIQTPEGFDLEDVYDPNPNGDTGFTPMVFDPIETAKGSSGRVYIKAASLVERMRSGTGEFVRVG